MFPREEGDESHLPTIFLSFFQVSIPTVAKNVRVWAISEVRGDWSNGKKGMKACHCFYIDTNSKNQLQGKRRKYLGAFQQDGPFDLNLCFQVNKISKLPLRDHLEKSGLLTAARPEAVGKVLSWRDWPPPKIGKWGSIALSFKAATTENDNTCLSNPSANVSSVREKCRERTTMWEPLKRNSHRKILPENCSLSIRPWVHLFKAECIQTLQIEAFRLLVAVELFFKIILYLKKQLITSTSIHWQRIIGKRSETWFSSAALPSSLGPWRASEEGCS